MLEKAKKCYTFKYPYTFVQFQLNLPPLYPAVGHFDVIVLRIEC